MALTKEQRRFAIRILRAGSLKWKARGDAMKAARLRRGVYECNQCKAETRRLEGNLDHVEPVIDPKKGPESMDIYIERLLCEQSGWQWLCIPCHDEKTLQEDLIRTEQKDHFRKKAKKRSVKKKLKKKKTMKGKTKKC